MVDIDHLIKVIVEPLCQYPEKLNIVQHESDRFIEFDLKADPSDVGRIIGRQGHVVQAIRNIVYAAKTNYQKRVRLNIN
ncbi:KH domain-containing protein [Agrilactobacillus fermenti]|uniref:KH domain-containing protein n=1 Tax=Agrilactobacillus fermenti TaxID=2586909 RepID=UPI001E553AC9|nr:KH domain-containing protein [Agrilactobacillus fermenti]MCD2256239.1 KH domain-containing protein [Agrilactobacillus fermenti]